MIRSAFLAAIISFFVVLGTTSAYGASWTGFDQEVGGLPVWAGDPPRLWANIFLVGDETIPVVACSFKDRGIYTVHVIEHYKSAKLGSEIYTFDNVETVNKVGPELFFTPTTKRFPHESIRGIVSIIIQQVDTKKTNNGHPLNWRAYGRMTCVINGTMGL